MIVATPVHNQQVDPNFVWLSAVYTIPQILQGVLKYAQGTQKGITRDTTRRWSKATVEHSYRQMLPSNFIKTLQRWAEETDKHSCSRVLHSHVITARAPTGDGHPPVPTKLWWAEEGSEVQLKLKNTVDPREQTLG